MSRAFVKDDTPEPPRPGYTLPDRGDPAFDAAAAAALLEGARTGLTSDAELATGYRFGEPRLVPHVVQLLAAARLRGDERLEQVAERFLSRADGAASAP